MVFRVRRMSFNLNDPQRVGGDMTFGRGYADFLIDSPAAVAQCVLTRLILWQGEWYLNLRSGTPWMQQILQYAPSAVPDSIIRQRILNTPYVTDMVDYSSSFNETTRIFTVSCKLYTEFGVVTRAPEGALISPTGLLVMPLRTPDVQPPEPLPPSLPPPDWNGHTPPWMRGK
jgi:hypothetical protein